MINLRLATINDSEFLFKCRNDDATRKYSHNSEKIDFNTHISWLENSLKSEKRKLYIAESNGDQVGTARADFISLDEENVIELSWTIAPNARGKGICKPMIKQVMNDLGTEKKFYAEIKVSNIASIKVAESLGMILKKEANDVLYYFK